MLQLFGLLIAFILLVAASGFAATHPALSAGLVFVFSLPYLLAAVSSRRAHYLYATMLLGAAAYFLACNALGAPGTSFPLLSVPLVFALWAVGQHLRHRLPEEQAEFPLTVFRAMNITVAVFSIWALVQAPRLIVQPGFLASVAGLTFVCYGILYVAHAIAGAPVFYIYISAMFLMLGAGLYGFELLSLQFCWAFVTAAAGAVLLVGTRLHRERSFRWSRHSYFAGGAVLVVGLLLALASPSHFLLGLAAASLVLLLAYGWLADAVGEVKRATTAERALAMYFFYGALALTAPAVPVILALPGNIHVAVPAMLLGMLWAAVAWQRRLMVVGGRNPFVLPAAFFLSAGLLGVSRLIPAELASGWVLGGGVLLMALLAASRTVLSRAGDAPNSLSMAEATVFPAFFAFYVPLMAGQPALGLVCAGAALTVALLAAVASRCASFLYAAGPAAAGAVVAGALLWQGQGVAPWMACAAGSAVAGIVLAWATAGNRTVARGVSGLSWLVLSVATVAVAYAVGDTAQVLFSATAVASIAVLVASEMTRRGARDAFAFCVSALWLSATAAAVALGPASGLGQTGAGLCLAVVALAQGLAWARGLSVWHARVGQATLALSLLLLIFGRFPALADRLWAGAGATAVFFVIGALTRRRFRQVAESALAMGHLTAVVMAVTALTGAWAGVSRQVALAVLPYLAIYALMPSLRKNTGFQLGAALWASLLALLGLAVYAGTPYAQQVARVAVLALVWIAAGYGLKRIEAQSGALALFIAGAALAVFCGAVSLFTPFSAEMAGSWRVFLISGLAFAALFLIMRQDIFAYLLTFSFALMAYDWIKASTSDFTSHLFGYLVIGCGVLGVFFLLPYAKRLLTRVASVPMFGIFTWRGAALVAVPVLGTGALVLSAYSLEITHHPKFCIACHYMDNYYESWQHSSHKDVTCVECHYAPGVEAEVKGKMGGLVQVVKYVSHTYGNKPHADIQNASCMRQGCHANIKTDKEILLFEGKIRFRHDKHLSGQPRGKTLNCVSCHGQVVQGTHISVTETTCLTCHFYGRDDKPVAAGSCTSCHNVPAKTVTFGGQPFNHKEFLAGKQGVSCEDCHSQVTLGDGHVTEARCRICHMSATLPVKDQVQFHFVHVSEQHFDCLQCHEEIQHGRHPMEQQLLTTTQCNTCHDLKLHTIQEGIYAGQALKEVAGTPDVMYQAGVACTGCHSGAQFVSMGKMAITTKTSGSKQCADCHNSAGYGNMLTMWQQNVKARLVELQTALQELEEQQPDEKTPADKSAQWQKLMASAREKLEVVIADGSNGAHNFGYVSAILDDAEADLNKCRSLAAELKKQANPEVALQ